MIGIRLADRCRNDAEIKICLELQEFGTEAVRGSGSVMVLHPALGGLMAGIARWQTEEAVKVGMCEWKLIVREITHEVSLTSAIVGTNCFVCKGLSFCSVTMSMSWVHAKS